MSSSALAGSRVLQNGTVRSGSGLPGTSEKENVPRAVWNGTVIAESEDTAWSYPSSRAARRIEGRVAFWHGVQVGA